MTTVSVKSAFHLSGATDEQAQANIEKMNIAININAKLQSVLSKNELEALTNYRIDLFTKERLESIQEAL